MFLQTLFKPEVILTDLLPYTEYFVKVEARNQFTQLSTGNDLFGARIENRTLEGGKLKYQIYHQISCNMYSYIISTCYVHITKCFFAYSCIKFINGDYIKL